MTTYVVYVKGSYQETYEVEANSVEEAKQLLEADLEAVTPSINSIGIMDLGEKESSDKWTVTPK